MLFSRPGFQQRPQPACLNGFAFAPGIPSHQIGNAQPSGRSGAHIDGQKAIHDWGCRPAAAPPIRVWPVDRSPIRRAREYDHDHSISSAKNCGGHGVVVSVVVREHRERAITVAGHRDTHVESFADRALWGGSGYGSRRRGDGHAAQRSRCSRVDRRLRHDGGRARQPIRRRPANRRVPLVGVRVQRSAGWLRGHGDGNVSGAITAQRRARSGCCLQEHSDFCHCAGEGNQPACLSRTCASHGRGARERGRCTSGIASGIERGERTQAC